MRDWKEWRQQIEAWQQPVLQRSELPEPLRMALFNELYDLCSGGSLWSAASPTIPTAASGCSSASTTPGTKAWMCACGSFALLQLWPELDKAELRSFARAIPAADATQRPIGWYFNEGKGGWRPTAR